MAKVKFSRKEFEKYVKLTDEVEERIAMMGTPFEGKTADEVEIEIFPNRPDMLSLQGFMRSFLAFIGKQKGLKKYDVCKPDEGYEVVIDKSVEGVRPYTACCIVKSLKLDDAKIKEIIDIQEKIHTTFGRNRKKIAIGIYPLEKIKLPIRFEARKPADIKFVPLGFDKAVNGLQILQQHPTGREYAHLLDGFDKFPVFVDADGKILSMPPVINSDETGRIALDTKDVFIECSGSDFYSLQKTLNILVTTLADMGGKIYAMNLKYSDKKIISPNLAPEKMKLSIANANRLIGLDLKEKEVKTLLEKMGYDYLNGFVHIPAYRVDVMHEVDLIEDIAIAYGYDKLVPEIPAVFTVGETDKKANFNKKLADVLAGLGLIEISSLHLLRKQDILNAGMVSEIEVESSKSDYSVLRPNLLVCGLTVLSENVGVEYPQKIFELGKVFFSDKNRETGVGEKEKLCVLFAPGGFTETKQALEYLGKMVNRKLDVEEGVHHCFILGRTGKILYNRKEIGLIGEIHPSILQNFQIEMPVAGFEVDVDELIE